VRGGDNDGAIEVRIWGLLRDLSPTNVGAQGAAED
jgi:hypothetical protein